MIRHDAGNRTLMTERPSMLDIQREVPTFAHSADAMLALVIQRVVRGEGAAAEVTAVLRRVCNESRSRPPELMLLRIKELWTKVAGTPRAGRDECDRRYYTFIGEALALYFESSPSPVVARRPTYAVQTGCGEPEAISPYGGASLSLSAEMCDDGADGPTRQCAVPALHDHRQDALPTREVRKDGSGEETGEHQHYPHYPQHVHAPAR